MENEVSQPKRLRRLHEIYPFRSQPLFFLTICTANRRALLNDIEVHRAFCAFCESSPEHLNIYVGRYVLMPDHIHVFVSSTGSNSLSHWVGSLKKYLAKRLRSKGFKAPFWQKGFFDHVLRAGESYHDKWNYVVENPIRAGLVKSTKDWPYTGEFHQLSWD